MSDAISSSFLYYRPATNSFLSSHLSFSKRLGESASREQGFVKGSEESFLSSVGKKESPLTKSPLNLNSGAGEKSRVKNNIVLDMPVPGRQKPFANKSVRTDTETKISFRHNVLVSRN